MSETTNIGEPQLVGGGAPSFLIKKGNVYYFTTGLWTYDPGASGLTAQQKSDCARVVAEFNKVLQASGSFPAVMVNPGDVEILCATSTVGTD